MDEVSISREDSQKILGVLSEIKEYARELAECARPLFDGKRFLSDAELARRLRISRSTLSNYRIKGVFGYYSLGGKILYADREIEEYLKENYHPPYR